MSNNKNDDSTGKRIRNEMEAMRKKLKKEGYEDIDIKRIMQDFFVKAKPTKKPVKKTVMTAAKGGMAKKTAAKKKMMRGGMVKKKK